MSKLQADSMDKIETNPDITIVIPAYNEENRIPFTLHKLQKYLTSRVEKFEVIVVDDGSKDGTYEVFNDFKAQCPWLTIIQLEKNYGKGCAVRTGMLAAKGKLVLFADADGSTPFAELERLEQSIKLGSQIAIGSRAKRSEDTKVSTKWYRKFLGQSFNRVVNFLAVPGIRDTQCGFKLFTRKAVDQIFPIQRADGFSFDVEVLLIARKRALQVDEVPVNWTNMAGSKVNLVLDAARMFRDVFWFIWIHRKVEKL